MARMILRDFPLAEQHGLENSPDHWQKMTPGLNEGMLLPYISVLSLSANVLEGGFLATW